MFDLESLFKGYKFGEIEKIFVCIYSYFVVGYIILFTTYKQHFLELQFSTQILLSIGISFPIVTFSILIMGRKRKKKNKQLGLFYQHGLELILTSIILSTAFSLLYITNYSTPFYAVLFIILCGCLFWASADDKNPQDRKESDCQEDPWMKGRYQ